jgi:hypothetical protein
MKSPRLGPKPCSPTPLFGSPGTSEARERDPKAVGKAVVNMRFDVALLKRIDDAARKQGISRTAWIHVAASKALE